MRGQGIIRVTFGFWGIFKEFFKFFKGGFGEKGNLIGIFGFWEGFIMGVRVYGGGDCWVGGFGIMEGDFSFGDFGNWYF